MKKYLIHVLYIMIIVFLIVFANIKANEADKQSILAKEASELAMKNEEIADKAAARAVEVQHRLEKELKECKSSK